VWFRFADYIMYGRHRFEQLVVFSKEFEERRRGDFALFRFGSPWWTFFELGCSLQCLISKTSSEGAASSSFKTSCATRANGRN
jgi:hypothetical protein